MVRAGRRKVLVTATLENRQENAYNTSLSVSFSKNLHLTSLSPQVQGMGGGEKWGLLVVWKSCPAQLPPLFLSERCWWHSEGGMHGPKPTCPALQCGAPCLPDWSQGIWAQNEGIGREFMGHNPKYPMPLELPLGPCLHPQVTFLLEFEFSCSTILHQVLVRLSATRCGQRDLPQTSLAGSGFGVEAVGYWVKQRLYLRERCQGGKLYISSTSQQQLREEREPVGQHGSDLSLHPV